MRRLIRHRPTNTFLSQGSWVHDAAQAQSFGDTTEAQRVVRRLSLEDVELYFVFGDQPDPRWDWTLPLESQDKPTSPAANEPGVGKTGSLD